MFNPVNKSQINQMKTTFQVHILFIKLLYIFISKLYVKIRSQKASILYCHKTNKR